VSQLKMDSVVVDYPLHNLNERIHKIKSSTGY